MKNHSIGIDEEELAKYFHHLTKHADKEKSKDLEEETQDSEEDTDFECVD